ncbi:hypothetical protein [Lacinutrix sp. Hel_I_90]|uniref:hypothetical protein n=1 Tax=Lacinutrix sp. Hel_I_90 TaxID=1249999 RepID=UPI0005C8ABF1|nr:hypothetical protein [Lacinutrix sp. Hel_I_90]
MDDEDFIALHEFILEMANVDFYLTEHFLDEEIVLKPKKIETQTPVQLAIEIDENNEVKIGAIPPMYYVETTFMPVFHNIKLTIETE